jgi:hypothetical protein
MRTGTVVLTGPSLLILAGATWMFVQRLISSPVLLALLLINFGVVVFLLPYFARLELLPVKSTKT